eukprot:999881-Amphidinium_carterae.2
MMEIRNEQLVAWIFSCKNFMSWAVPNTTFLQQPPRANMDSNFHSSTPAQDQIDQRKLKAVRLCVQVTKYVCYLRKLGPVLVCILHVYYACK